MPLSYQLDFELHLKLVFLPLTGHSVDSVMPSSSVARIPHAIAGSPVAISDQPPTWLLVCRNVTIFNLARTISLVIDPAKLPSQSPNDQIGVIIGFIDLSQPHLGPLVRVPVVIERAEQ
ncbi:unnamed protein product [Protopolystoma xenopodis]|uniref:Uncharacterized protein n=1 Tax=Protopolystoma xenopodis TaxID=117903 RepID=A0A448X3X4_9PLAT|nr:unnamed protein product [Protopolystoma xenopodis]